MVTESSTAVSQTGLYRRYLVAATRQFIIGLPLVWLLCLILVNLSFVEGLRLPDIPFTMAQIITFIVYLVAFVLLVIYADALRSYWPRAFPRLASLTPALTVVIYVVLLSLAYRALLPIILSLVDDPGDFILLLGIALAVLALVLLAWAGKMVDDGLPGWLSTIRFSVPQVESAEVACLDCGRLNPTRMKFCGYCGHTVGEDEQEVMVSNMPGRLFADPSSWRTLELGTGVATTGVVPLLQRNLYLTTPFLRGEDVRVLQQKLFDLGYTRVGEMDGIVGPITWSRLFELTD